uniref:TRP domain-containing protein n=1 Tax=Gongylonema pulchrum TaxID=637853 RepID=A0A183EJY1_9BILA
LAVYLTWISLIAIYVINFVPDATFKKSIFIAVFSALTIQTPYQTLLGPTQMLVLLLTILLAAAVKMLLIFLLVSLYEGHSKAARTSKVNDCSSNTEQTKFDAVVHLSGETKLAE